MWAWDKIAGDLTDLPAGGCGASPAEITLFKSVGLAVAGPCHRPTRRGGSGNPGSGVSKSVVIVGGGLVGLSSALFLTEAGAEVTIIDNGALGGGGHAGTPGSCARRSSSPFRPWRHRQRAEVVARSAAGIAESFPRRFQQ